MSICHVYFYIPYHSLILKICFPSHFLQLAFLGRLYYLCYLEDNLIIALVSSVMFTSCDYKNRILEAGLIVAGLNNLFYFGKFPLNIFSWLYAYNIRTSEF